MSTKVLNGLDLNSQRITSVADPSSAQDAATKAYVDQVAVGINDLKDPVKGAATGNLALTALVNGLVHDGVTYATGDRILLPAQSTGSQNGIYVIAASGTGTRALDANASNEVTQGMAVTVLQGTTKGTGATVANPVTWILTTSGAITLDTTALTFSPIGTSATAYVGGNGLVLTGTTFDVGAGTGISVAADSVGIDTSVVTRKFAAACAATTNPQTFTHNLGTLDVDVNVIEVSTGNIVLADVTAATTNTVSVNFGGAPTAGQYRVNVAG